MGATGEGGLTLILKIKGTERAGKKRRGFRNQGCAFIPRVSQSDGCVSIAHGPDMGERFLELCFIPDLEDSLEINGSPTGRGLYGTELWETSG